MLAARLWARGDVRVEEIPDPEEPKKDWVRIRVDACGICGTDVEEYRDGPNIVPTEPHPVTGASVPLTLGHEVVGVVDGVGAGVELAIGTPVALEANLFCGVCFWCRDHRYQLCTDLASLGLNGDGGLAEWMLAPASMCVPYADDVPVRAAALAEPLSVAVRAVRRAGIGIGSTVGVVGAGTIGLLALQAARVAGARTVIVVERLASRRQLARDLGADIAVTPEEAQQASLDLTRGIGLDTTIEAAGNAKAAAAAVALVRRGGRAVLLGVFDDTVPVDMMDFLLGEKEIVASLSHVYDTDFVHAVDLLQSGRISTAPLITDTIHLKDVVTSGLDRLLDEPEAHLKILVTPNGLLG